MNFQTFPVSSTNIFPLSNSKAGGQLATEWNLKSREMVATSSTIKYLSGPSYTHAPDDFLVRVQQDATGTVISHSTLEIMPGDAVVDGHFVQSLEVMTVDLIEANIKLKSMSRNPLKGRLGIGIRAYYSTETTMAGAMLVENDEEYYEGIQLVVLPEEELITPIESPDNQQAVTCHLKLATFIYSDGTISNIVNETDSKLRMLSADRIANIDKMISKDYVTKKGLNPKRLYTFAGKGTEPETGYDTWCDSTDALMIWDAAPRRTTALPQYAQAQFATLASGETVLVIPHKQIDGMVDGEGNREYYEAKSLALPVAKYGSDSSGTVDAHYTRSIKAIDNKITQIYQTVKGKQVGYLESFSDGETLPTINNNWEVGDYILVAFDYTAAASGDSLTAPSTMYAVIPGLVTSVEYVTSVKNSEIVPEGLTGIEVRRVAVSSAPDTTDPTKYPVFYNTGDNTRGRVNQDYFVATHWEDDVTFTNYYYKVASAEGNTYSTRILVTGEIPFAQEDVVGGFYNVSPDAVDAGYVYRDDTGRLRVLDYDLLRSGTLAYQLGQDITLPTGLTTSEVQAYLDEFVNNRIAFPTAEQALLNDVGFNVVNVYIDLSAEQAESDLYITNVDSRFNTCLYLHFTGSPSSTTRVHILDCQKVRIDNQIPGSMILNVYRTCLYYDPVVFNYVRQCRERSNDSFTGFQDIKIWYAQFDETDPYLTVNDMTIRELEAPIIANEVDFWNQSNPNDEHYLCALHSLTFSGEGDIIGCSLLVSNQSTNNIMTGKRILSSDFVFPQGSGLIYPKSCMTKQLKVSGTFVSAYKSDNWVVTDTKFTVLSDVYDPYSESKTQSGSVCYYLDTELIDSDIQSIPGWEPDTYHIFDGGAVS